MRTHSILCALLAFSAVSILSLHQAPRAAAGSGTTTAVCHFGKTKGLWNLPEPGHPGFAQGLLYTSAGAPLFHLDAKLVAVMSTPTGAALHGHMDGVLTHPLSTTPTAAVFAKVSGEWHSAASGAGTFKAAVYKPGPTSTTPPQLIGTLHGKFLDSPLSTSPTGWGHYEGVWKICN